MRIYADRCRSVKFRLFLSEIQIQNKILCLTFTVLNPISSGVPEQREAPGGGLGDPHYLIPVKQKIEISALVQWHIYSK